MFNLKKLLLSCYVLIYVGVLLTWVHQDSLETFWQQSYHRPPPWQTLKTGPLWQAGSRVRAATAKALESFWDEFSGLSMDVAVAATALDIDPEAVNRCQCIAQGDTDSGAHAQASQDITQALQVITQANHNITKALQAITQTSSEPNQTPSEAIQPPEETTAPPVAAFKPHAKISAGQRVFFAGDSMMQGIAPHLAARLRREYGVSSLDLSQQSTGLAYPCSFNWPETIEQTLEKNPDIKLLAIFLGPNDPWDMPPDNDGEYLTYGSPDWEALYRSRIRNIISAAQSRHVDIIWISSPNMRRQKLSKQVHYLNGLYESEVLKAGEVFLSANEVFQYPEATYSDYMGDGSLTQKMRSDDGIHFTRAGQRFLANALFERIVFTPEQQAKNVTQSASNTHH